MNNKLEQVKEFMHVFGQSTPETPVIPRPATIGLRIKLIDEEKTELMLGLLGGDLTESLDAICDLLYVVYGAAVACGISSECLERNFEAVHHNNMSKFWTTGQVERMLTYPEGHLDKYTEAYSVMVTARRVDTKSLWVVTDEHGKIIKPMGFEKVEIKI